MRSLAVVTVIAALGIGCATTTTPTGQTRVTYRPLSADLRSYLLDPVGSEEVPGSTTTRWAKEIYSRVIQGDLEGATSTLGAPGSLAGDDLIDLLTAQIAFADSRFADARSALGREPNSDAGLLLSGRLYELNQDPAEALRNYWTIRERSNVAAGRVEGLLPAAVEVVDQDFLQALEGARLGRAQRLLSVLSAWVPERELTLRSGLLLTRAVKDLDGELSAWRRLYLGEFLNAEELISLTELEIARGSADRAVEIARGLAADPAGDPLHDELLARAEFNWRARLLPAQARAVLSTASMTRADFSLALYWFFPQVRYARSQQVRIATDILEHPNREEIAQVVNAGLLHVDRAGHRFYPDLPMSRQEAIDVVLRLMRTERATCLEPTTADACSAAVACGVLEPSECSLGSTLSGGEFANWARRAQESLTRR